MSIWSRKDNPVPRKKSPENIPGIFSGLKPETTFLFENNIKIPNARGYPNGDKIITRLWPSQRYTLIWERGMNIHSLRVKISL